MDIISSLARLISKPAPTPTPTRAPYAQCERPSATAYSPVHLRFVGDDGELFHSGGITDGTTALCGRTMDRGWDLEATIDAATARKRADAWTPGEPGGMCARCAAALPDDSAVAS